MDCDETIINLIKKFFFYMTQFTINPFKKIQNTLNERPFKLFKCIMGNYGEKIKSINMKSSNA